MPKLPDTHFGEIEPVPGGALPYLDDPYDDDELIDTPQDVIDILGFDPAEDDDGGGGAEDEGEFEEAKHPRDKSGKFSSGGGSTAAETTKAEKD